MSTAWVGGNQISITGGREGREREEEILGKGPIAL